tara:strand:+ start:1892 stop:3088 length:1197 start_codon:yes stop_codon:yes gene_type:complete
MWRGYPRAMNENTTKNATPIPGRFRRLWHAMLRRSDTKELPENAEEMDHLLDDVAGQDPSAFVEPNLDKSTAAKSDCVVYQYGASVCWLAFNHTERAIASLTQSEAFPHRSIRVVNKNWPFRTSGDLVHWLDHPVAWQSLGRGQSLSWHISSITDTSTSRIPFYNPMLPTIAEDAPPHYALLVMGGNDLMGATPAMNDGSLTPEAFGKALYAHLHRIVSDMKEAKFTRVAMVPLNRQHVPDVIKSSRIPEAAIDEMERVFDQIAQDFPDFVYLSERDLHYGLHAHKDYLDSPYSEFNPTEYWEDYVYTKVKFNDKQGQRKHIHPNPEGQRKVGETMRVVMAECIAGKRSPALDKPQLISPTSHIAAPASERAPLAPDSAELLPHAVSQTPTKSGVAFR